MKGLAEESADAAMVTPKELAYRWKRSDGKPCSSRTVRRKLKRFKQLPAAFDGRIPLYRQSDIAALEKRDLQTKLETLGYTHPAGRVYTVKEVVKHAQRGGRKGKR